MHQPLLFTLRFLVRCNYFPKCTYCQSPHQVTVLSVYLICLSHTTSPFSYCFEIEGNCYSGVGNSCSEVYLLCCTFPELFVITNAWCKPSPRALSVSSVKRNGPFIHWLSVDACRSPPTPTPLQKWETCYLLGAFFAPEDPCMCNQTHPITIPLTTHSTFL